MDGNKHAEENVRSAKLAAVMLECCKWFPGCWDMVEWILAH